VGWTYAWRWPYMLRNCLLFESYSGLKAHANKVTQLKRRLATPREAWSFDVHGPVTLQTSPMDKVVGTH